MLDEYLNKKTLAEQSKYVYIELYWLTQAIERGIYNPIEMPGCFSGFPEAFLRSHFKELTQTCKDMNALMTKQRNQFIFENAMKAINGLPSYNFDRVPINDVEPSAPPSEEVVLIPAPSAPPVEEVRQPERPYLNPHYLAPIVMPWPEDGDAVSEDEDNVLEGDFLLAGYRQFRGKNNAPRDHVEPPLPIIRNAVDIGRAGQISEHDMVANSAFGRSIANNRNK